MIVFTPSTTYYCPYCGKTQWLFSLKPVTTDEWVCTKCKHPFLLDVRAIAHNWLNTITFWSLFPLGLFMTVFLLVVTKPDKRVWAVLIGMPVFTFGLALMLYVACIPIALIAGNRIRSKKGPGSRGLKFVVRDIS